jgi:hypothetical protein
MADETTAPTTETQAAKTARVGRELLEQCLGELGLTGQQKTGYAVYPIAHGRQLRLWMNRSASSCARVELMGFSLAGEAGFHNIPEADRDGRAECGVVFAGADAADVLDRVRRAVQAAVELPVEERARKRSPGQVSHEELPAEKRDDVAGVRTIQDPAKMQARLDLIRKVAAAKKVQVSSSLADLFVAGPDAETRGMPEMTDGE